MDDSDKILEEDSEIVDVALQHFLSYISDSNDHKVKMARFVIPNNGRWYSFIGIQLGEKNAIAIVLRGNKSGEELISELYSILLSKINEYNRCLATIKEEFDKTL